ncbi:MAG: cyclase family protein [Candidatus Aminicenantes bacterium]|nr:cyclase family protein [Candidatus Aminicenantes bacterium]
MKKNNYFLKARPLLSWSLLLFFMGLIFLTCKQSVHESPVQKKEKILDLTYPFDENSIYWPTAKPFQQTRVFWGRTEAGYWYASNEFSASEHGGTHVDAPIHFAEGGRTIDQIPLEEWIGQAVKIDVTSECLANRNYLLQIEDILEWEKKNGQIEPDSWVIMYTGIGTVNYPDKKAVLGTDKVGQEALPELSFPAYSPEVTEFLIKERKIKGLAIDTPSIDFGQSKDFKVHQILCGAEKLALENIANLDQLPEKGAILYVIPMLIKNGTGAPARVFAVF